MSSPATDLSLSTPGPSNDHTHNEASLPPKRTVCQIKDLNKNSNRTIKARITKRSLHSYKNGKKGRLLNINLRDNSGEIKATVFNDQCDKFDSYMQVDKVYYISNYCLDKANKQFNKLNNDYEMKFTAKTEVLECTEDISSIPANEYDFVSINEIANKNPNTPLDVIGICISVTEIKEQKQHKLREINLADSSGGPITLTIWNDIAENFEGGARSVVLAKGAKVTEYKGRKNLSASTIQLDPERPEAHDLRTWYDAGGANDILAKTNEWITFKEADARQLVDTDETYKVLGVVSIIIGDDTVYKACPQSNCTKKLDLQDNGLFNCQKCNKTCSEYKLVLRIEAVVSDLTDSRTIRVFHKTAEAMLGRTATEVQLLLDSNKDAYARLFEDVLFKTFVFKVRNKTNIFMDTSYLEVICDGIEPFDYKELIFRHIKNIKLITGLQI